jgi:hypothetical protein
VNQLTLIGLSRFEGESGFLFRLLVIHFILIILVLFNYTYVYYAPQTKRWDMVTTVQPYQLNNVVVDIDLARVSGFSETSKDILQNQLHTHLPPPFHSAAPLTDRIHTLESTAEQLQNAKENSTKDKLIACLKTAVLALLLAGTILLAIYAAPTLFLVGLFPFMILSIFCLMDAYSNLQIRQDEGLAFGAIFGMGLIIPLYEGLSRVSRLGDSLKKQQASIQADLTAYQRENSQLLPQAYRFFKEQSPDLLARLGRKIEDSERALGEMEQMAERSHVGEKDMRDRIFLLQKTKEELNAVAAFYRQFDPR